MSYYPVFLIDTGMIVALFNRNDEYHSQVYPFIRDSTAVMITTVACITETIYLLPRYWKVQNDLFLMVAQGIIECEHLQSQDFTRIAELNIQYADIKPDFADLALVAISERLDIPAIATLDKDFDIYRRYRKQPFERVFFFLRVEKCETTDYKSMKPETAPPYIHRNKVALKRKPSEV